MSKVVQVPVAWLVKLIELSENIGKLKLTGDQLPQAVQLIYLFGYIESCQSFIKDYEDKPNKEN